MASILMFQLGSARAQTVPAKVAQYMNAQVAVNHFAGSILIARNGRILTSQKYGSEKGSRQLDDLPDGRYRLGSINKQFVAASIMQLVERDKLRLKDSICRYVVECPPAWERVTILNLLTQTDGIPDVANTENSLEVDQSPELLALLRGSTLESSPGQTFHYGTAGYALLTVAIESASHEPYPEYVRDHIFIPLGMRNTGFDYEPKKGDHRLIRALVTGSLTPVDLEATSPYIFGRLHSTPGDLYRWVRGLAGETILSRRSRDEIFRPRIDGYGFGWAIFWEFDRQVDTQSSGINLLSSSIRRYPSDDACVIVLSNLHDIDAGKISRDLAAMVFGKQYDLPAKHHHAPIDTAVYKYYVGRYEFSEGFTVEVTQGRGRLMIQSGGGESVELIPESETRFFENGLNSEIFFVKGANGVAAELMLLQGGRAIPARRF